MNKKITREFKVNKFITLKLVGVETQLYVNDEEFGQCASLLLYVPAEDLFTKSIKEIDSVDEAAGIYGLNDDDEFDEFDLLDFEKNEPYYHDIPPETEFWGHCSNIQAWVEHDYDTRLLHTNLAFPLLKKLADVGDSYAKRVFKEEIVLRLESNYPLVITYLVKEGYTDYLNDDELNAFFDIPSPKFIKNLQKALKKKKGHGIWDLLKKKPNYAKKAICKILENESCDYDTFEFIMERIFYYFPEVERNNLLENPSEKFVENAVHAYKNGNDDWDPMSDDLEQKYSTIYYDAIEILKKIQKIMPERLKKYNLHL